MSTKKKNFSILWIILAAITGCVICAVALLPLALEANLHLFGQKFMRFAMGLIIGEDFTSKISDSIITFILFTIGTAFVTWMAWLAACREYEKRYKALLPALYTGSLVTILCAFLKFISSGHGASWSTIGFLFLGVLLAIALIAFYWFCWDKFPKIVNKETVNYVIFGCLATIVNLIAFNLSYYVLNIGKTTAPATIIAWVVAVIFAFFTNKTFVFESKTNTKKELAREAVLFFSARLFSCFVTVVGMWLLVDLTHIFSAGIGKIVNSVIELTLNYVFSKLIIFKKKPE